MKAQAFLNYWGLMPGLSPLKIYAYASHVS